MVQTTVKMYNLQELVRKAYLKGLINSAVILFKDNRMKIEAIGFEDEQGIVDQTITVDVNYPTDSMTEGGEVSIGDLGDLLSKLELFERDDIVQVATSSKNELIIVRNTPPQTLTYDLADIKFIKTYSTGLKTIFGSPIRLVKLDGKEKHIAFDCTVILDGQKLKEHGSKIEKIKATNIPISAVGGKLVTDMRGETSGLMREVEGVTSVVGSASSSYDKEILTIFNHAIGTATLRLSEGTPIHIHYEHESMTADYLLQVHEER
jgi:hypothetical protein